MTKFRKAILLIFGMTDDWLIQTEYDNFNFADSRFLYISYITINIDF
jgi:hypothetical protein